ncbi:hypothetical protein [Janibacter melonis]|uniref:hypothetical protein n=1 Tax=Janibacter melonis TaxID=262209 RepID=UPI003556B7A2
MLVASCLAYVADMSVLEPAFRRLGSARHLAGSRILSMSHSMVFHALPASTAGCRWTAASR